MADKTGLVMEGGAMRGMFTAGALDVFMENGITFDGAIGVSAGATFGCNIKSHQAGRVIRYNKKYCADPRYGSYRNWLRTGDMFDVKFCYDTLPHQLDPWDAAAFAADPMEFWVVATNVQTGRAEYHRCTDGGEQDLQWIRASASIPLVSHMVELDGMKLLDGGIADSVPLAFFESQGYKKNVVILTQPLDYRKAKNKLTPLCRAEYHRYPAFAQTFADRWFFYNQTIGFVRAREEAGTAFVLRPKHRLDVKSAEQDPAKLQAAYEEGREAALEALEQRDLRSWLNQN